MQVTFQPHSNSLLALSLSHLQSQILQASSHTTSPSLPHSSHPQSFSCVSKKSSSQGRIDIMDLTDGLDIFFDMLNALIIFGLVLLWHLYLTYLTFLIHLSFSEIPVWYFLNILFDMLNFFWHTYLFLKYWLDATQTFSMMCLAFSTDEL